MKIFNLNDSNEEHSYTCHETAVTSTKVSKDGRLLLTTAVWRYPISALWNLEDNQISEKLVWDEEDYVEFANITPDRVLATTNQVRATSVCV